MAGGNHQEAEHVVRRVDALKEACSLPRWRVRGFDEQDEVARQVESLIEVCWTYQLAEGAASWLYALVLEAVLAFDVGRWHGVWERLGHAKAGQGVLASYET